MRELRTTEWPRLYRTGSLLLLVLWGCVSGPAPTDHHYRLDVRSPEAPAATRLSGVLQVDRLRTDALSGERDVLYRQDSESSEIRQYSYHLWSDPPAILIQTELVRFLDEAGAADTVIPATARVQPDYLVSGRLSHFEQILDSEPRVSVEIHLTLTSSDGRILTNQTYHDERAAADRTVAAATRAFGQAVHDIFERFLADLGASGATS
jgi:ABC-type uncharacterized transport system auxiliary subunit